jgi:hypothetical protein
MNQGMWQMHVWGKAWLAAVCCQHSGILNGHAIAGVRSGYTCTYSSAMAGGWLTPLLVDMWVHVQQLGLFRCGVIRSS